MSEIGPASDEELFARSVAGDVDAFVDVFERHADAVLTHCVRCTGRRADAEDVAGAVFLEAWRCRSRVRFVDGSALPWLYVVSYNVAGKAARARHRQLVRERRFGREDVEPDHADETADRLDLCARAAVLARCLDELSPRHREVVRCATSGVCPRRRQHAPWASPRGRCAHACSAHTATCATCSPSSPRRRPPVRG